MSGEWGCPACGHAKAGHDERGCPGCACTWRFVPGPAAGDTRGDRDLSGVWIDPARRSGEPCLGGTRLGVDMIVAHVWSHGVDSACDMWDVTRGQILHACWYAGAGYPVRLHNSRSEYRPHRGPWRKRWGEWARQVHADLWASNVDPAEIQDPPTAALLDAAEKDRQP